MTNTNKILLLSGALALFFIFKIKRPSKMINESEYFNKLTAFIKNKEGGLSNDAIDSASKYPSPTPQKYHTNKGITYKTFIDSASALKYAPSVPNFLTMPDNIWLNIFRQKYYNKAKYTSQPILNGFIAYWLWQGWDARLLPVNLVSKVLASSASDLTKLNQLVDLRKEYYNKIVQKNPSQARFKKGWHNTAIDYQTTFAPYL